MFCICSVNKVPFLVRFSKIQHNILLLELACLLAFLQHFLELVGWALWQAGVCLSVFACARESATPAPESSAAAETRQDSQSIHVIEEESMFDSEDFA